MPDRSDHLGFLVADIARLMRRAFQARLDDSMLSFAQARTLVYLARAEGQRQVDLAEQLEIQPITVARLLDQLADAGLVERRTDPADRRAYRLYLTPAAAPRLAQIRRIGESVRAEALEGLSAAEARQAVAALRRVRDRLSVTRGASRASAPRV